MAYRKIALVVILLASSLACRTPFNPEYWFNLAFDSPPTLPPEMSTDTPAAESSTPTPWPEVESTPAGETTSTPYDDDDEIQGQWIGMAQWLCDNNLPWEITMVFSNDGSANITAVSGANSVVENAGWTLNGEDIQIQFKESLWEGTMMNGTMQGIMNDTGTTTGKPCNGVWYAARD